MPYFMSHNQWLISCIRIIKKAIKVENKILFTGTPTAELNSDESTAPFVLRTAYNSFNGSLLVSFLKPEMLICINNFDPVTFDETFFMDAVRGQGLTNPLFLQWR